MNNIEVCLTPDLIIQHELSDKIVVVVDIFRATSCIVSGLSTGIAEIYPVGTIEECLENGDNGMITAGERGGQKVSEFDIGNSPFDYMRKEFKGRQLSVTTTNGTKAINESKGANEIILGAFLNLSSTASYLEKQQKDLVIHCAGWKGTPNLEDTIFAGALIEILKNKNFTIVNDSALIALNLYQLHKYDLLKAACQSSHAKRLSGFGVRNDIEFCLKIDEFDSVIKLQENKLVAI